MGRPSIEISGASLALLLSLCSLSGLGCMPGTQQILSPAYGTRLPDHGEAVVSIDLGGPLEAGDALSIWLVAGSGPAARTVDVTARLVGGAPPPGLRTIDGTLGPGDGIVPGANGLVVTLRRAGESPGTASTFFTWTPGIDLAALAAEPLERCDPIEPGTCLLPFPNDHFTRPDPAADTGRRVNLSIESTPVSVWGVVFDPSEWNRNDGFSPGAMMVTRLPGVDLERTGAPPITDLRASLDPDAPFALLDAETGERQLFWAELDANAFVAGTETLILRPGRNLRDGRRYIVALADAVDAAGDPLPASDAFRLYRDDIRTLDPRIEARRRDMERMFATIESAGIERERLVQAWEFTVASTRNLSERLLHMRDDAFAALGDEAPAFQVTAVQDQRNEKILRRVDGTFEVPLYLTRDGRPGARLHYDLAPGEELLDQLPSRAGGGTATYTARFRCVVPRSASADGATLLSPARISLYGHGLLGSAGETGASHVEDMASEHNIIFCGTDAIGMANDDVQEGLDEDPPREPAVIQILKDISLFPALPDRLHQGILNHLFLGRLMMHPEGLASDPNFHGSEDGLSFIDGRHLFYDGNSQGGILGGAIAAVSQDLRQVVLGVPGMNYSTLLRRSVDFDPFLLLFSLNYDQQDHSLLISLMQMLWDRGETNGHANHLTSDPYPGTPAKNVLLHVAWGDFQVANVSAEVEARTIGAAIHRPALAPESRHWESDPFVGLPEVVYPHPGSALVYWDSGNLTPPNTNEPPREGGPNLGPCAAGRGGDPHECPRREVSARLQKSEFLRQAVDEDGDGTPDRDGRLVNVCGEELGPGGTVTALLPCLAPGD